MIFLTTPAKLREIADKLEKAAMENIGHIAIPEVTGIPRSFDLVIKEPAVADAMTPFDYVHFRYFPAKDEKFKGREVLQETICNMQKNDWEARRNESRRY